MPFFECSVDITSTITSDLNAADRYEAASAFRKLHGRLPDDVGDDGVIGMCEACERALFEGDDYSSDEDGVQVCATCCRPEALAEINAGEDSADDFFDHEL